MTLINLFVCVTSVYICDVEKTGETRHRQQVSTTFFTRRSSFSFSNARDRVQTRVISSSSSAFDDRAIRSLDRVLLQIQPSGGDPLPFPRAWLPGPHCSAMFDDASLCTWGRAGGCDPGFDVRVRTRTGMCRKRQSFSDALSDHSALRAGGKQLFVGLANLGY